MSTEAENMRATRRTSASAQDVFDVLADPTSHVDIDGTGWVSRPLDTEPITAAGQRFRMAMYHDNHPDKNYEMTNEIDTYDRPRTISWRPGQPDDGGVVRFGGWMWRYELVPNDGGTDVTLIYDWSEATPEVRSFIQFPPFPQTHLENSLAHLAGLAESAQR